MVLFFVAVAIAVAISALGPHGTTKMVAPAPESTTAAAPTAVTIFVHVLGAVTQPGLYELGENARTVDAIAAAGGFTDTADESQLNLARFVSDGEQIAIPEVGEVTQMPPTAPGTGGGKVNLNTADATTLETLPRVGPTMSARIIDWRTANGRFTAIDDLTSITGIGEKTYVALKDLVTV